MFKRFWQSKKASLPPVTGQMLVSDFQSAMTNLTTAATANYSAKRSEEETLQTIESANPEYVTTRDIDPAIQEALVRSSMNAHMQKVQAEQINSLTEHQVAQMEEEDKQKYLGKKIQIQVIDKDFKPLESFWQDKNTGEIRQGQLKSSTIKGTIEDVAFRKNTLVIKPNLKSRLILPDRKFIFVYVINPDTLVPAVQINLI